MNTWTILGPTDGLDIMNYAADYITCGAPRHYQGRKESVFSVVGWKYRPYPWLPFGWLLFGDDEIVWKVVDVVAVLSEEAEI